MSADPVEPTRRIRALEAQVAVEQAKRRLGLRYGLEQGKARFEEEVLRLHKEMRTSLWRYVRNATPLIVLTAPFIYALIIPLFLLDVCVTIYQAICFPIYRVEKVRRRDYLIFDRRHLPYLNALEKLNCAYCSYANGLVAYVGEIAARTEAYWCPIKHARKLINSHAHYPDFAEFGDARAYRQTIAALEPHSTMKRQPPTLEELRSS